MLRAWKVRAAIVASTAGMVAVSLQAGDGIPFLRPKSNLVKVAKVLDDMEEDLHEEGTIVIKAPDVWGESRLTKHRQEFERVMAAEVDGFELLLNASIRRSDQAYLANALAIQAALDRRTAPGTAANPTQVPGLGNLALVNSLTTGTITDPNSSTNPPINRTNINQLDAGQAGARFVGFDGLGDDHLPAVGLEPTIRLDQMKRYLDHLNEIRRINEGDDTSDSPGYSLNLVRVPISILPGEQTREGWGAEIEMTCKQHDTPELLSRVFRELVINDLVDALGVSTLRISEAIDDVAFLKEDCGKQRIRTEWYDQSEDLRIKDLMEGADNTKHVTGVDLKKTNAELRIQSSIASAEDKPRLELKIADNNEKLDQQQSLERVIAEARRPPSIATVAIGSRNSRQPLAGTQVTSTFGQDELLIMGYEFWKQRPQNIVESHLPDARAFLKEHLDAGFDYLTTTQGQNYWHMIPEIHEAVRNNNVTLLHELRSRVTCVRYQVIGNGGVPDDVEAPSPVAACAWWILVESALLNEQLNDDMQRVSQDPDCGCMWSGPFIFYGVNLQPDAQQAFIEYVHCRWPIHVFALDPVVQQQNVADQYSMRREMQLALALAFASGRIGAQSMSRYARRLELDMETIALNQTQVAFSHGSDTFGWRFLPRVQTPPFESTHQVIVSELIMGGPNRDALRKRWELEPGMRECVAIVLMPSFIEHVTFHARGNFFEMKEPEELTGNLVKSARWSERLKEAQNLLTVCYGESDRYLGGEVDRIRERVDQLAKQLPLQTVHSRVPNENTLGGFEMFSSGITDLGPELLDFYGHPGVDTNNDTTLFLVGNHFSVHETQVIAGNRECHFELVSREVMKVTIPAGVQPVVLPMDETNCPKAVVDVHIATPYGVSAHLDIPVINDPEAPPEGLSWSRRDIPVVYRFKYTAVPTGSVKKYEVLDTNILVDQPQQLTIELPPYGTPASTQVEFTMATENGQASILLMIPPPSGVGASTSSFTLTGAMANGRKQIVLSGAAYGDFHRNLRQAVVDYLIGQFPNGGPPGLLDVTVRGKVTGTPGTEIGGDFHLLIKLDSL